MNEKMKKGEERRVCGSEVTRRVNEWVLGKGTNEEGLKGWVGVLMGRSTSFSGLLLLGTLVGLRRHIEGGEQDVFQSIGSGRFDEQPDF